ncbi:MAG: flagellar export chaperone FliS [Acidimicrobiales bacterium]
MNQREHAALAGRYQNDGMAGSSPQKLLLAVFDRLQRDLQDSMAAIDGNQIEAAHRSLVNAQELVFELNLALAPDVWPAALELRAIYEHLMTLLIDANMSKSVDKVEQCLRIVNPLAETWAEAHRALQEKQLAATPSGSSS